MRSRERFARALAVRLVEFDADDVQLAVMHTALRAHFIRELRDRSRRTAKDDRLQTVVVIEVRVHRRHRQVVMFMLHRCQPLAEVALVVVENVGQAGHALLPGWTAQLRLAEFSSKQVSNRFRAIGVAALTHPFVELLGEPVVKGNGESFHGGCSVRLTMHCKRGAGCSRPASACAVIAGVLVERMGGDVDADRMAQIAPTLDARAAWLRTAAEGGSDSALRTLARGGDAWAQERLAEDGDIDALRDVAERAVEHGER